MKNVLIASSALVAVAFVSQANAADPIRLSIGGYGAAYSTYASQSQHYLNSSGNRDENTARIGTQEYNAVNVYGDSEIHFKGETTLDNGITVAAKYEFNANGNPEEIIDTWAISAAGVFGTIKIGADSTASDALYLGSADYDVRLFGGTVNNDLAGKIAVLPRSMSVVGGGFRPGAIDINPAVNPQEGDAQSLTYFTPSLYGFTLGASYHPSAKATGNSKPAINDKDGNGADEAYSIGLQWKGTVGQGVSLGFSAAYGTTDTNGKESVSYEQADGSPSSGAIFDAYGIDLKDYMTFKVDNNYQWGLGGQIGYAGFSFGGSFKRVNIDVKRPISFNDVDPGFSHLPDTHPTQIAQRRNLDKTVWELGLSYDVQPYVVSLNYTNASAQQLLSFEQDDKLWQLQLTGQYAMGPGVKLEAGVAYVSMQDGMHSVLNAHHAEGTGAYKNQAWVIGTGLNLSF